ncbi:exodeoxyribonuclease V subunit beta [Gilliamella sp. B2776]|uniref:exodeoxyribonuclease V subunit beta n=1 Tax=unclassified Gilliamella TaxID=2685620 RepID=UPI00226AAB5F|nr:MULTISPECIES: exodeoxyribonuclease V subunit beta [unclassified Gilliamella]MCX8649394.1 exodeoxyribonuclease V subunit beta [Gilliamella sp. B2779]MCX8654745.1 exodeoxyribonuclease V subunit beta [Gilliamella sp. B2737]MCX8655765.1 exodeoxyribonuclease V subunit beta [Gilliamella sp. B2894]MCX8663867.1 exodeoxyribonuclease V subunit beta [Gilliamella sp. B2887]MCX8691111.1 exodeoxyribonuclease V subunit beta [Gilliamella sp. B2776]
MVSASSVKKLNLFDLPLTGRSLIEASAGTGKTYSLAFIYLRLLLGIGQNSYPKPLDVNQILVVTFTKAATQELRSRIRQNIQELRLGLLQGYHQDPIYQKLIEIIDDRKFAVQKLTDAQQSMDDAAIYTIHSFCQRILTSHAFESGVLFEQTLMADEYQLQLRVAQDFWRHYFTPLDKSLAYLVIGTWQDPATLLKDIKPYLTLELKNNNEADPDISDMINTFYQNNFNQIEEVKRSWLAAVNELTEIITQSGISKQSYSSRNLPNWINKVTTWANQPTQTFELPNELERFCQSVLIEKTKDGKKAPYHCIFAKIELLYQQPLNLRSQILMDIVGVIQKGIYKEKLKQGAISFDDLIWQLNRALYVKNGKRLAQSIASQYCVALIDEFQDTDPLQYQIFNRIYDSQHSDCGLLFIGDPKQAIYSFRGADIFTYLEAKRSTGENHYTMDVNQRSSASMVNAVNQLFANHDKPFVFDEIPFLPMQAAERNRKRSLLINKKEVSALTAYLLPESVSTNADYQQYMASCCAQQIVSLLSNSSVLSDNHEQRPVMTSDIAILVRTGREAEIIQQKLAVSGVKSVYLSNHNSVFSSSEAKDVLCLLQAVLMPENESTLRLALMTSLFGQTMTELEQITEDQDKWESLVEEFKQYQVIWLYYGVLVMLRRMMKRRHLAENILARQDGERTLTNLMHLGELLQEAADELDSPHALVRWLTKQIVNPDLNIENHEQRLESDDNLVKIITIHKSKGLEFPIVWLPFISMYRSSNNQFYHDKDNDYKLSYAWLLTDEIKQQIEDERLAEDLRLLYVAMTRSVYHCSIGLASLKKNQTAINHLLKNDLRAISSLANLIDVQLPIDGQRYVPPMLSAPTLSANVFKRKLSNCWRVTSYTELQRHDEGVLTYHLDIINDWDESQPESDSKEAIISNYNIHHFPKGAYVGTLMHSIMEQISPDNIDELCAQMVKKLNLNSNWNNTIANWMRQVLATDLGLPGLNLSKILMGRCINELQFYLPIRQSVTCQQLDSLCKKYDDLSQSRSELSFDTVQGMLKGFIDLIFEFKGKYYLVDYKSNWLGDNIDYYGQRALKKVMEEHRYDLQYQLYSLALHRFLRSRLSNYQFQTHFGGVYYLFLRGMPDNGIFYHQPKQEFIEKLDQLFEGEEILTF